MGAPTIGRDEKAKHQQCMRGGAILCGAAALPPAYLTALLLVPAKLQASAFMIAAGVAAAALAGRAILRQTRAGGSVFTAFGGAFGNTIGSAHKVFALQRACKRFLQGEGEGQREEREKTPEVISECLCRYGDLFHKL